MPKRQRESPIFKMVTAKRSRRMAQKTMTAAFLRQTRMKNKYFQAAAGTPELKFQDVNVSSNLGDGGIVALLNGLSEGTTDGQRVGAKINVTDIEYDLAAQGSTTNLNTAAAFPNNSDCVRVAVVYDKQTNGAAPTYGDIYTVVGTAQAPFSQRNISNVERFDILATEVLSISAAGPQNAYVHRYIKCALDTRYFTGANAGTVADISTGGIFLVFADQNNSGANQVSLQGRIRIKFRDV